LNLAVHLSKHDITQHSTPNSISTIVDTTSKPKISPEQSVINWVVNSLALFDAVEHPNFQVMFKAHGCKCAILCADTSLEALKAELELNCSTISLSFDGWTTKSNIAILAIISYWIGPDFIYQKAVIEFAALKGVHSDENMALVVFKCIQFLNIMHKLLAVTSDSTSNNGTLVTHLHQHLLKHYDDEFDDEFEFNMKSLMQFQGAKSHIHCLAHALNRMVCDILTELKSWTMKEAQDDENDANIAGPIVKLR
jgi:hypothetical protein